MVQTPSSLPNIRAVPGLRGLISQLHLFSLPVAAVVALALGETLLGGQAGKVTGGFYAALLDDKDKKRFLQVLAKAAACFAAAGCVKSCSQFLSEQLALQWRWRLTEQLQQACGRRNGYLWLKGTCDNLDQRLLQDVLGLCTKLAVVLPVLFAAPFKVAFYSVWVARLTSKASLAAIYAFFVLGVAVQR